MHKRRTLNLQCIHEPEATYCLHGVPIKCNSFSATRPIVLTLLNKVQYIKALFFTSFDTLLCAQTANVLQWSIMLKRCIM